MRDKIIIQGELGCFHEEAALKYFGQNGHAFVPAESFPILAAQLDKHPSDHIAIMAIENSIAGSLLQNYRILREHGFRIVGEVYLRIRHNLMALPGQNMEQIKEVVSHPMALNQCLVYLRDKPMKMVESEDTALSAKRIAENRTTGIAAIAGRRAAELYGLEILAEGIETSKVNYTRFFIVQAKGKPVPPVQVNKASIYLTVVDGRGKLLKVLEAISRHDINLSKLQSYPVLGELNRYYFHLDLEFDNLGEFEACMDDLKECTESLEVLGTYKKAEIDD
ncbi:prephenate dehydratase [Cryomorphaceae bacterium 1068]|nr:prephenate dehydratase [Cryomorphaceae bacterium 1068]